MIYPLRWLLVACVLSVPLRANFVQDLVRIHTEALGGQKNVDALKAIKVTGLTRNDGGDLRFLLWAARPNRIRTEVTSGERTIAQGWDGAGEPWTADSKIRRIALLRGLVADEFKVDAEFDDPLIASVSRPVSVDYVGEVELDGRTLLKLVVMQNPAGISWVYLDPGTYLMVRRELVRRRGDATAIVQTDYSEFKAVAGVLLPHVIRVSLNGRRLNETIIDSIEPNPPMPADLFKVLLPAE